MKIISTLLIILSITAYNQSAEAKRFSQNNIEWGEELDLSKNERTHVDAIKAQSHEQILSLMKQIETLNKEIAQINEQDEIKIRDSLNEKQKIKFDKIKNRMNKNNPEKKHDKGKNKPSRKRMRQY